MHPLPTEPSARMTDALNQALDRKADGKPASQWFDRRVRGHMEALAALSSRPLPPPQAKGVLQQQLAQPAERQRVIYVHVPFCKRICTFCGFFRKPSGHADLDAYTQAADHQFQQVAGSQWVQSGPAFRAVYFGGGTPTALAPEQLVTLIQTLRNQYPLAEDCEITVECRFDGLSEAYLQQLRDAGVNRLSFGVQSFNTAVRQGVGRLAQREQVFETLNHAHRLGFAGMSVDLIYNLPDQTAETWTEDFADLAQTPATACSTYALIPMRGSTLVKQLEAGRTAPLGDVTYEYQLFQIAHRALSRRSNWQRYSFQHFGDAQRERSVYNHVRAGGMDTLGLGCGAGGQIGNLSYMNLMDVEGYTRAHLEGQDAGVMAFLQNPRLPDLNHVHALVEGQGIARRAMLETLPHFEPTVDRLIELGLVREHGGQLTLTPEGCFWGYNITAMLVESIAATLPGPQEAMPHPHASHHHEMAQNN